MDRRFHPDWLPTPSNSSHFWNLLWTWQRPKIDFGKLHAYQRVNHFPDARQLTRKDWLKRHLQRYRAIPGRVGDSFDIMPVTYTLPGEFQAFAEDYLSRAQEFRESQEEGVSSSGGELDREEDTANLWIVKPVGLSRGRGISVVR